MRDLKRVEEEYECDVYPKRDVLLVKGKNAVVQDQKGKQYIDCMAGHGVASVGHCNQKVVEAIVTQAKKLITCTGTFYNDIRALFLEKLISISPKNLKRAFLCNSGAESIEAALKFARYTTGKREFICALRGFHGRTFGALSATFNPKYRKDFEPLVPGFRFVPFNNFEKIAENSGEQTAGVILEIVQGEGGIYIGDNDYFQNVRDWCKKNDVLLIIDEVQTGFCRTGKMFACNHFDLQPDIMCVAKAMAGGIPMGAVLCSEQVKVPKGNHGSTFGGNPLACAAAFASINFMIENNLAEQSFKKGSYLKERLLDCNLKLVREVRGLGLMIGIELKKRVKPYMLALIEEGLLTLPAGKNVLRLLPPLTISYKKIDTALKIISNCLKC